MRCRRPSKTGAVTMSSPVGLVYSPVAAWSASERSARIRFSAATYDRPESVSVSLRAERSKSLAPKCSSSSVILRLAVATGVLRRRAAAERLPASATASTIDMASRRSIARPFHGAEWWIPVSPNRRPLWKPHMSRCDRRVPTSRAQNRRALMTTSIKLDTLRHVIEAHGGLKNWNKRTALSVDLVIGGMLWGLKGQFGKLERTNVAVGLGEEWASHQPFGPDNRRTRFCPDRVAIEDAQGKVLEELAAPRASFTGHALETPWTEPQLAYFAGYAMWTYLNLPFLALHEGVEVEELPIWHENREAWRPFRLTFP